LQTLVHKRLHTYNSRNITHTNIRNHHTHTSIELEIEADRRSSESNPVQSKKKKKKNSISIKTEVSFGDETFQLFVFYSPEARTRTQTTIKTIKFSTLA